jgi:hypothetical protein
MTQRALAVFLAAAGAAYCADWRVRPRGRSAVEKHYGVKRTHVPLMGVANLFRQGGHPAGTSGFKLAMFEDLPSPSALSDRAELDRFMDDICRGRLHPWW